MAVRGYAPSESISLPSIPSAGPRPTKDPSRFASSAVATVDTVDTGTNKDPSQFPSDISTAIGSSGGLPSFGCRAEDSESDHSEIGDMPDIDELQIEIIAPPCPKPKAQFSRGRTSPPQERTMTGISMFDVHDAIRAVDPNAVVACLCSESRESIDDLPNLMEASTSYIRRTMTQDRIVFLLVEDSVSCFCAAVELLKYDGGLVLPVLMTQFASANASAMCEKISVLVDNGADDVVILPTRAADLNVTIAASLAKGKAHRKVANRLQDKIRGVTKQCDQLFWQVAHEMMTGFPEERQGLQEIPAKRVGNLALVGKLGEGNFGAVYKCQDVETGRTCAVKVFPKSKIDSHRQIHQITQEYSLLRMVSHVNVAAGLNFVHGVRNLYIIMEMAGQRNLFRLIRAGGEGGMPWPQLKPLVLQIADGVAHLHDKSIAHCDLKPENVTITEDGCAKIVDFGQAIDVNEEIPELKVPRGTMPFVPPEVMRLSAQWDPKAVDLWQIGVTFFEMLCGNSSFVELMGWSGKNLMSLTLLPERAGELVDRFNESTRGSTLAAMSGMCTTPPPSFAMTLLTDMLEPMPGRRLPAHDVTARLKSLADA
jgi:aurora kinase